MDDWDDEEQREWLAFDYLAGTGVNDAEAAGMLCRWLECILDGRRAIRGEPAELPRPPGVDEATYRTVVREVDDRYWDMTMRALAVPRELLAEGSNAEEDDGSAAIVSQLLGQVERQRREGRFDWYEDRRHQCVAALAHVVRRYRRHLAMVEHNRDEQSGRELRRMLQDGSLEDNSLLDFDRDEEEADEDDAVEDD
jgi:hypothetical protein